MPLLELKQVGEFVCNIDDIMHDIYIWRQFEIRCRSCFSFAKTFFMNIRKLFCNNIYIYIHIYIIYATTYRNSINLLPHISISIIIVMPLFVLTKFVAATFHRSDLAQLYTTFCQLTISPLTLITEQNWNYLMPVNCIPKISVFFLHSHTQSIFYIELILTHMCLANNIYIQV